MADPAFVPASAPPANLRPEADPASGGISDALQGLISQIYSKATDPNYKDPGRQTADEMRTAYANGTLGKYLSGAAGTALNSAMLGQSPRLTKYLAMLMGAYKTNPDPNVDDGPSIDAQMQATQDAEQRKLDQFAQDNPGSSMVSNLGGAAATLPVGGAIGKGAAGLLRYGGRTLLPDAAEGAFSGLAAAANHPVAAPLAMGAGSAAMNAWNNPNAPISDDLKSGLMASVGTALLGKLPVMGDEISGRGEMAANSALSRAYRALRPSETAAPAARIEPTLPAPVSTDPAAVPAAAGNGAGLSPPAQAPMVPAPNPQGLVPPGTPTQPLANPPVPASAPPNPKLYQADIAATAAAHRGGTPASDVANMITSIASKHGVGISTVTRDMLNYEPGLPSSTMVNPSAPSTRTPVSRQVLPDSAKAAALQKLADHIDANNLDIRIIKPSQAASIMDGVSTNNANNLLKYAKVWAQDAPKLGISVGKHLANIAKDPKTYFPAIAGMVGAGTAASGLVDEGDRVRDGNTGQFVSPDDARVRRMRAAAAKAMKG